MPNINAWEGLLLLSTAGLAATTQRLTDICHSGRYLQQPARSVFRNNKVERTKFSLRPRSHLEILRWCRRASTLLQEGQAESPGSCLLSRTWEIGRGEEILDPHLSTLP